jgi:hypothetical protein
MMAFGVLQDIWEKVITVWFYVLDIHGSVHRDVLTKRPTKCNYVG